MNAFLPIISLVLPLVAIFIEAIFPYPYIVEELLKASLVLSISNNSKRLWIAILIGALFALTETILYSTNIYLAAGVGLFIQRLIFTSALHASTTFLMAAVTAKSRVFIILGLPLAMLIHYIYNASQIPL